MISLIHGKQNGRGLPKLTAVFCFDYGSAIPIGDKLAFAALYKNLIERIIYSGAYII